MSDVLDNSINVLDKKSSEGTLTDKDIDSILGVMRENAEKSPELKILNEPNKTVPATGQMENVNVMVNPITGEKIKIGDFEEDAGEPNLEESLSKMGESYLSDNDITPDDIDKAVIESDKINEGKFNISEEATIQLIEVINNYKADKTYPLYPNLPQEIRDYINEKVGTLYSPETNRLRYAYAKAIIDDMIKNIDNNKFQDSFNQQLESIWKETGTNLSGFYKEYEDKKADYLKALLEKVPEGDPKREHLEGILEAINDAFTLTRIKDYHIKIKSFEREKPKKIFDIIEFKYRESGMQNIYSIPMAYNILERHNPDHDNLGFLIKFCKLCKNYSSSNPVEHAFMYYVIHNITLLDIYKNDEYNSFSTTFLDNLNNAI